MPSPFEPLQVGPITLRNRFIKSGANEAMSRRGAPTRLMVDFHRQLAAGDVGLNTMAYGAVTQVGRTLPHQIVLSREVIPDLAAVAEAVHDEGGKLSMQITHGGAFVTSLKVKGRTMSSSSGIYKGGLMAGNPLRRAMDEDDMATVIEQFVAAARVVEDAGFDAVELHMGHGYLLNQFISPLDNKRRDEYGGSAENRARFPARVLAAVKDAVGSRLAVLAKINCADGVKGGATADDGAVTAKALQTAGADMIVLSGGRNVESTWFMFGSKMNQQAMSDVLGGNMLTRLALWAGSLGAPRDLQFKPLYFREYSRQIRAAVDVPLAYLGGVNSLEGAQQALDDGFEAVVLGRSLIHDPHFVQKLRTGELSRSGCSNCNACVAYIYHPGGTRCIENPPNEAALNEIPAREVAH
jgi:2,4-dienoyl-CoA reductase-like NADH-dependent reductase (Old Yellow Enzyme family)